MTLCSYLLQAASPLVVLCPQLTFSEPRVLEATPSQFEVEPVQGRKVSKVVKMTVVRGERVEKQTGDRSLAAGLPSAKEDFQEVSISKRDTRLGVPGASRVVPRVRKLLVSI